MEENHRLLQIERQLEKMMLMMEHTLHNTMVLYKRTAALAHMLEAIGQHQQPRMTQTLRAEVDATLHPDEFVNLFKSDRQEFIQRYGQSIYDFLTEHGVKSISKFGVLAAQMTPEKQH